MACISPCFHCDCCPLISSDHQHRGGQEGREGWVEQVAQQLMETRQQTTRTRDPPSIELADAEKKLAEVSEVV